MKYHLVVIGAGPGGYVAALRGAQLGLRTAVVEREHLGGVCLNWGCIPTKTLLHCAQVYEHVANATEYGVEVHHVNADLSVMIQRSRDVATNMRKGVEFLLRRAGVQVFEGQARFVSEHEVEVQRANGGVESVRGDHILIATGAHARREAGRIQMDGRHVIGYREALALTRKPNRMVIIGSGAIGCELAMFYHAIGTEVTLLESAGSLLPREDEETGKLLGRAFRRRKLRFVTDAQVTGVSTMDDGAIVHLNQGGAVERVEADLVVLAVGVTPNVEGLNLEGVGVQLDQDHIRVNERYETNVPGIYAIGDVLATPALAHVASAEGTRCVEWIAGHSPSPLDYSMIPTCTYTWPEVGSVGAREQDLRASGRDYLAGKYTFMGSGKATAISAREGQVKLLFDRSDHRLLGAHIIGASATELIGELSYALHEGATAETIHEAMHPHPTLCEAVAEAAAQALGCCVHA